MRRTLKLAVMMLLIVAAFSCQKDEESNTSQIIGRKLKAANDPLFLLDIPTNNWCTQTGTNCASTVEIVSTKIERITDMADNPSAIAEYFSSANYSEWSAIFPYAENSKLHDLLITEKISFEILQDPSIADRIILRMHTADESFSIGFPFVIN